MADVLQTIFSISFFLNETCCFLNVFPMVQIAIIHHCLRLWPGTEKATSHYLDQPSSLLINIYIYTPLSFKELKINKYLPP